MNPAAANFEPPPQPRIEGSLPDRVRNRIAAYAFRDFAPDQFDPSFTATDSNSVMRQAIADVGLDVDETAGEAKTQHAAALREWRAEWDSDAAPGESEPSEQADAPSKDGESESRAADAETEDADDVPPSLHFSDPPNLAQQLFEGGHVAFEARRGVGAAAELDDGKQQVIGVVPGVPVGVVRWRRQSAVGKRLAPVRLSFQIGAVARCTALRVHVAPLGDQLGLAGLPVAQHDVRHRNHGAGGDQG